MLGTLQPKTSTTPPSGGDIATAPTASTEGMTPDQYNDMAYAALEANMATCEHCGRTFAPDRLAIHQRSCTAEKPARRPPSRGARTAAPATKPKPAQRRRPRRRSRTVLCRRRRGRRSTPRIGGGSSQNSGRNPGRHRGRGLQKTSRGCATTLPSTREKGLNKPAATRPFPPFLAILRSAPWPSGLPTTKV